MVMLTVPFLLLLGAWESHGVTDGILLETRRISGSAYEYVRASVDSDTPVKKQIDAIWGTPGWESVANKGVRVHEVIDDVPNRRRYYEVISAPMISDRDYVLELERKQEGELWTISFRTVADPRKPPVDGKIRLPKIEGVVTVEPNGAGCTLTYELFCDLGGSLPAWVARGAQRDSTLEWVRTMLARGRKP